MTRHLATSFLIALFTLSATACEDAGVTGLQDLPAGLSATWFGTSLLMGGSDLMDSGTRIQLTLTSDGIFQIVATGDQSGFFCEGTFDCQPSGTFGIDGSIIVFDPDDGPIPLSFDLTATTLRLTGNAEGTAVDWSFVIPPLPNLLGTWIATDLQGPAGPLMWGGATTTLAITFEADGSFAFGSSFSPPGVFCDVELSCFDEGTYVATADAPGAANGQIVIGPNEPDPATLQVVAQSNALMLSGLFDGVQLDWTLTKHAVSTPGLVGKWFAVSLLHGGTQLAGGPTGGTLHRLVFTGILYQSNLTPESETFLCDSSPGQPSCISNGAYEATLTSLQFLDGFSEAPLTLSTQLTPITLRLSGSIGGVATDFFYVRVPAIS